MSGASVVALNGGQSFEQQLCQLVVDDQAELFPLWNTNRQTRLKQAAKLVTQTMTSSLCLELIFTIQQVRTSLCRSANLHLGGIETPTIFPTPTLDTFVFELGFLNLSFRSGEIK